jgi:hypothetical protein
MNLFVLSRKAEEAARAHPDKHVVKMTLEACQMLYTAHWSVAHPHLLEVRSAVALSRAQKLLPIPKRLESAPLTKGSGERGFRPVHIHHPCTVWVRASLGNYLWACDLAIAIGREYEYRWPGHGEHSCLKHALWLRAHPPVLPLKPLRDFAIAMDAKYRVSSDPVECYIAYFQGSKAERGLLKYTRREFPECLKEERARI